MEKLDVPKDETRTSSAVRVTVNDVDGELWGGLFTPAGFRRWWDDEQQFTSGVVWDRMVIELVTVVG